MNRLGRGALRGRDEAGSAVVEFVWLGILLLVPLIYVLLSVFDAQRGAFGANTAARAAGRAFSLAPSEQEGRRQAAEAARLALQDQGVEEPFELVITCRPQPCLSPGSVATVRLQFRMPLPLAPDVFGSTPPAVRVSATHRVPSGKYVEGPR